MKRIKMWSWSIIWLTAGGILLNMLGVRLATSQNMVIFLDSTGTILVAILGGMVPGIMVGFFSNVINSVNDPITLYYGILSILIAMVAAAISDHHGFAKLKTALLSIIPFSLIGGVLGSMLTWLLYGFDFGSGISAPFAKYLYASTSANKFVCQLIADFSIDVFDKTIVVLFVWALLRIVPSGLLKKICRESRFMSENDTESQSIIPKRKSIRTRFVFIIAASLCVLCITSMGISYFVYRNSIQTKYEQSGKNVATMMRAVIPGSEIETYLAVGEKAPHYLEVKDSLIKIKNSVPDISYLYVYQIKEDGCHVVFDLDTSEVKGCEPGSIQPIENAFLDKKAILLAGGEIDPIVWNGSHGRMLTTYAPIYNDEGVCKAYAAVDISMENVISNRYVFVIRMGSILFGVSIIILCIAIWVVQKHLVAPINKVAALAKNLHFGDESHKQHNLNIIHKYSVHTGDEIENVYRAFQKSIQDTAEFIDKLDEQNKFIQQLQDNIILSFADMVENRDENTGGHIKRTAAYVETVAKELMREHKYPDELNDQSLADIVKSAPLHDIGKIKIPDSILLKPGKLTAEEFELIKTHTTAGKKILEEVLQGLEKNNYLQQAINMANYHHEKWNGTGYPEGLSGEDIPLGARIMAIADVFDALVSKRCYKESMGFDEAVKIIQEESGKQFDPEIVVAFVNSKEKILDILNNTI